MMEGSTQQYRDICKGMASQRSNRQAFSHPPKDFYRFGTTVENIRKPKWLQLRRIGCNQAWAATFVRSSLAEHWRL